jgi:IPT/TIG domain
VRSGAYWPVPAGAEELRPQPRPTILSVTPSIGSTGGGASITITGAGLLPGIRVAFGATNVAASFNSGRDWIAVTTPSHRPDLSTWW